MLTKHHRLYRRLFLGLVAIILLSPFLYGSTGIGQAATGLSAEVRQQPNGVLVSSPKAEARHRLLLPMRIQRMLIYPLLLISFQLSGGALVWRRRVEKHAQALSDTLGRVRWLKQLAQFKHIRRWMPPSWRQRLSGHEVLVILLFILTFYLALFLLYLPFNFYRGFTLAHQFGLSTQSASGWLGDWLKSVLIALVTNGLLWTGFYALMRIFPRRWPIPGGAALFLVSVVFTLLTPLLITPLFFEVRPLDDADLRVRIFSLTERASMPVDEVFVIDASSKTTQVNAYVSGFGEAQRMVLYDTLLAGYTPDQVEVVLAHELGHWYHRHVLWSLLGLGAAGWLALFGLQWLLNHTWRLLGLRSPADVASLPYILAVMALVSMLALPIENGISRYAEGQADEFALNVSQKPEATITLFIQFSEQNLSIVNPPAWEKFIFYTHPPTAERIARARAWQQSAERQSQN